MFRMIFKFEFFEFGQPVHHLGNRIAEHRRHFLLSRPYLPIRRASRLHKDPVCPYAKGRAASQRQSDA